MKRKMVAGPIWHCSRPLPTTSCEENTELTFCCAWVEMGSQMTVWGQPWGGGVRVRTAGGFVWSGLTIKAELTCECRVRGWNRCRNKCKWQGEVCFGFVFCFFGGWRGCLFRGNRKRDDSQKNLTTKTRVRALHGRTPTVVCRLSLPVQKSDVTPPPELQLKV